MRKVMTIAGLLTSIALDAALAQSVTPSFPGVQNPVPAPQQAPVLVSPSPPGAPPRLESFGDRATRCLHSYPLGAGQGGQPADRDSYVRQCANN